jgi:hypothetical protein
MKNQFTLFQRNGVFYSEDTTTGKQSSLRTRERTEAERLLGKIRGRTRRTRGRHRGLQAGRRAWPASRRNGLTPYFFACRLAAMTMPSPFRPPPTHTGRPSSLGLSAISQLAKKESPSRCKMRLLRALTGNRHATASPASVHAELFTAPILPQLVGQRLSN